MTRQCMPSFPGGRRTLPKVTRWLVLPASASGAVMRIGSPVSEREACQIAFQRREPMNGMHFSYRSF